MNEEIQKLAERIKEQDSRIAALEKFVRELATEALGDSQKNSLFSEQTYRVPAGINA